MIYKSKYVRWPIGRWIILSSMQAVKITPCNNEISQSTYGVYVAVIKISVVV
jgi:hypothetical protein